MSRSERGSGTGYDLGTLTSRNGKRHSRKGFGRDLESLQGQLAKESLSPVCMEFEEEFTETLLSSPRWFRHSRDTKQSMFTVPNSMERMCLSLHHIQQR